MASKIPNGHKILPNGHKILPNGHNIYQHLPLNVRPSKIYPKGHFWFENKTSGIPGSVGNVEVQVVKCQNVEKLPKMLTSSDPS
jgi:hypothetical protein